MSDCKELIEIIDSMGFKRDSTCSHKAKYIVHFKKGFLLNGETKRLVCGKHLNYYKNRAKRLGVDFEYEHLN